MCFTFYNSQIAMDESGDGQSSSQSTDSSSESGTEVFLVEGYDPYIADVPLDAVGDPFPTQPCVYSARELGPMKESLRKSVMLQYFDPPIRLDHFCLIVKERWKRQHRGEKLVPRKVRTKCCICI